MSNHSCNPQGKGQGCGCGNPNCSCGAKSSCCSCGGSCNCSCHKKGGHEECNFAHELLDLADEAWMEVLKEKIKEDIKKGSSEHLDKLAQLVTDTNKDRWRNKMARRQNCEQFGEKLKEIFRHKQ